MDNTLNSYARQREIFVTTQACACRSSNQFLRRRGVDSRADGRVQNAGSRSPHEKEITDATHILLHCSPFFLSCRSQPFSAASHRLGSCDVIEVHSSTGTCIPSSVVSWHGRRWRKSHCNAAADGDGTAGWPHTCWYVSGSVRRVTSVVCGGVWSVVTYCGGVGRRITQNTTKKAYKNLVCTMKG
jgi:hypothetical protein